MTFLLDKACGKRSFLISTRAHPHILKASFTVRRCHIIRYETSCSSLLESVWNTLSSSFTTSPKSAVTSVPPQSLVLWDYHSAELMQQLVPILPPIVNGEDLELKIQIQDADGVLGEGHPISNVLDGAMTKEAIHVSFMDALSSSCSVRLQNGGQLIYQGHTASPQVTIMKEDDKTSPQARSIREDDAATFQILTIKEDESPQTNFTRKDGAASSHNLMPTSGNMPCFQDALQLPLGSSGFIASSDVSMPQHPTCGDHHCPASNPASQTNCTLDSENAEDKQPGYRTADRVSVVRVPSFKLEAEWKIMVEKHSLYNTKADGMDSFKYAATLNEWDTWARHHNQLSSCQHLVHLHGFTKRDGAINIYSEFCAGGDVQALLDARLGCGLDEKVLKCVARHVLRGLSTLHTNGLVYGDLKPSNVFISKSSDRTTYKIGDFGTMREQGRQHLHYFVSGFGFTPEYAPPEVLDLGTEKANSQADLWSFGIMLHELATGTLPLIAAEFKRLHDGQYENSPRLRKDYILKHPLKLALPLEHSQLSPMLQQVIQACLHESPSKRPLSALELLSYSWFQSEKPALVMSSVPAHDLHFEQQSAKPPSVRLQRPKLGLDAISQISLQACSEQGSRGIGCDWEPFDSLGWGGDS